MFQYLRDFSCHWRPRTAARIATVSPVWDPGRIVRRNGVRTLTVRAFGSDGGVLPSQVLTRVKPAIDSMPVPPGYRIWYGGEFENQNDTLSRDGESAARQHDRDLSDPDVSVPFSSSIRWWSWQRFRWRCWARRSDCW